MSPTQEATRPYWSDTASFPRYPALDVDTCADVVVVGAGVTGLTVAWLLANRGARVVVLERDRCACADTGHTSAHLTMVTDARLSRLVERFGRDGARAVWDAGAAAASTIEAIARRHAGDAGFARVDGYLHAPRGKDDAADVEGLKAEADLARALGFDAAYVDSAPLVRRPAIRFPNQARVHVRRYLAALARACSAASVRIREGSAADTFLEDPVRVKVGGCTVRCDHVIMATHTPMVGLSGSVAAAAFQSKLARYTSYVVAAAVPRDSIPDALWWDTGDPYDYLRVARAADTDVVLLGGEDHKTGQESDTKACFTRLTARLRELVPGAVATHRWSGQVVETPDGLPYIGKVTANQYVATGFAGNGLTFGTLAAMLLADQVTGRENSWSEVFDPGRTALTRGTWDYVKENLDYPYYLVRDRVSGPDAFDVRDLAPGEGRVIDLDGQRVAVSRDDSGQLITRSATCTHMGCVVAWNAAERTWDCPCHGSRFTPTGHVVAGPAETPLAAVE